MKTKFLPLVLILGIAIIFSDCRKVIEKCACTCPTNGGGGKDTISFETIAQAKLDSLRNGLIGKAIGSYNQFSLTTYQRTDTTGTGIEGGTVTNIYDLNGGWQAIKYNDYPPSEPDAYIIYKVGEALPDTSTTCGGIINLSKALIFIPPGKSYDTNTGWVTISNQTLLYDETHPLPYDDRTICTETKVYAGSNATWAMYFSFN